MNSLLREYLNKRARTEYALVTYMGTRRDQIITRAELRNRWSDFREAVGCWLRQFSIPFYKIGLIETTKPGASYRTYEALKPWWSRK